MIGNLQDELYQLENKRVKAVKLRVNIRWGLGGEYLSYILMMINQNILAILRTFSNLQKVL